MKQFYLTIDYELFLGDRTGSVQECMINPTYKLAEILAQNASRMTVFWDILHFQRCLFYVNQFSNLQSDIKLIKEQIIFLILSGHDVQLHLHPHWLDAVYDGYKWNFSYEHFSLQSLNSNDDINDIFSLRGCVHQAKELMKQIILPIKSNYEVTTFRAGGYMVEPFDKLFSVFKTENIKIDSSVCPCMYHKSTISPYDFRNYPKHQKYSFENTPKQKSDTGRYLEYPIRTIYVPLPINIYFILIRIFKYPNLEGTRKGSGVGTLSVTSPFLGKLLKKLNKLSPLNRKDRMFMLTTDGMFAEKFDYLYSRAKDNDVMILHPKLLNYHTMGILVDKIKSNKLFCKSLSMEV